MFYPEVLDNQNTRESISQWMGYNHNYRIDDAEFYDMQNLTSDNFPLLSPRSPRPVVRKADDQIRGMIYSDDVLAYLAGNTFYYGTQAFDFSEFFEDGDSSDQQLIRHGANILIFPAGLFFNTISREFGTLGANMSFTDQGSLVEFVLCDETGNTLENEVEDDGVTTKRQPIVSATTPTSYAVGDGEPLALAEGDIWLDTVNRALYLYDATNSTWIPKATCYLKIRVQDADFDSQFNVGDAVFMNSPIPEINEGSIIQHIDSEVIVDDNDMPIQMGFIVVICFPESAYRSYRIGNGTGDMRNFYVQRKIPQINYACVSGNRVWGCFYGAVYGELVNEIYVSALGDPTNWYLFEGTAADSYSLSIGDGGAWTGCIEYQGYPTFFKENVIYKIYGRYPAEYQLVTINCRGAQIGSSRSIAICGEYLLYKSAADVCVFDGSTPVSISNALGKGKLYYHAAAGSCLNKYYISMEDAAGDPSLFVYDMDYNIWHREDARRIDQFSSSTSGQMFGCGDKMVYGFGSKDNIAYLLPELSENFVDWYAVTGELGYEYPGHKFVDRLSIRAYIPTRSGMVISISYDDGEWKEVGVIRGDSTIRTQTFSINPLRCDHFRLKFEGHGDMRIYTLSRTLDEGSEE